MVRLGLAFLGAPVRVLVQVASIVRAKELVVAPTVIEGATGVQTIIVSNVSNLLRCYMPSNHNSVKCFWSLRAPQAFKPLWFQVFLDF